MTTRSDPMPPSPCNRRCTLDPDTDVCLGCYRRLDEITAWSNYSAEEKLLVLKQAQQRRDEFSRRRSSPKTSGPD